MRKNLIIAAVCLILGFLAGSITSQKKIKSLEKERDEAKILSVNKSYDNSLLQLELEETEQILNGQLRVARAELKSFENLISKLTVEIMRISPDSGLEFIQNMQLEREVEILQSL